MDLQNAVAFDCEVYPNYTLVAFKRDDQIDTFECFGPGPWTNLQIAQLKRFFLKRTTYGFNSRNYDQYIVMAIIAGKDNETIWRISKKIITSPSPPWIAVQGANLPRWPYEWSQFDVAEPTPGVRISLKLYGGRMHAPKLQDLPYDPLKPLTREQADNISDYCINDLDTTIQLFGEIRERMDLRLTMSEEYETDLMSKSDAQIAETVIKKKMNLGKTEKAERAKDSVSYHVPSYVRFLTPEMKAVVTEIGKTWFHMDAKGSVLLPKSIAKMAINIGGTEYQLGIGGLHSKDKAVISMPEGNELLVDKDVTSYYPQIILGQGLYPSKLGPKFLTAYQSIVDRRLAAKAAGDKVTSESLKIVINGTFGKLGNRWSVVYDPQLLLQVTMSGQLSLLMLIERLWVELGIPVISANTDGFVSLFPKTLEPAVAKICNEWEEATGFELEETQYAGYFGRDVNNYMAVKLDGTTKTKGVFVTNPLTKNPTGAIIHQAVEAFLKEGKPIKETVYECQDIKRFVHVRTVNGGAIWKDEYLGRVVRWVWSTKGEAIVYKKSGNKVALSDGAWPVMDLAKPPLEATLHVNRLKYIEAAYDLLDGIIPNL